MSWQTIAKGGPSYDIPRYGSDLLDNAFARRSPGNGCRPNSNNDHSVAYSDVMASALPLDGSGRLPRELAIELHGEAAARDIEE